MTAMEPAFTVTYKGSSIDFIKIDTGFAYLCPKGCCRAYHHIDTASGTRHRVTSAPGHPVTIVASLLCPCKDRTCGWHVFITDGVAVDC